MKLYFAPNTCSLFPHILLNELELSYELVGVDIATKTTDTGRDFLTINPKGYVAALELGSGEVLTEGVAIAQYLADLRPEKNLAPANGTLARVRLQEALNFVATELHGGAGPLFNPNLPLQAKEIFQEKFKKRLDYLEALLAAQPYVLGKDVSLVDFYVFTVVGWCKFIDIDLGHWPALTSHHQRIHARPAVERALKAESSQL